MLKLIKGIIFDLDGVICHTDHYHYLAWKQIADEQGIYFDEVINNRLRGVSRMESLNIILEGTTRGYSDEEKIALTERKNDVYRELLQNLCALDLSDEVKETLVYLRMKRLRIAIGSSSKNAKLILERIGLDNFFDAISDGTNISNSKPDPEVFLRAAEMLGLMPEECLVVEDATAGILAAQRGGFQSAAIGDAATMCDAKVKLNSFSDLKKCISL